MPLSSDVIGKRGIRLRVMLCGAPNSGKTATSVGTAPGAKTGRIYVINTDSKERLEPPKDIHGAKFVFDQVKRWSDMERALEFLSDNVKDFDTVVFDNLTSYNRKIVREAKLAFTTNNYALNDAIDHRLMYPIEKLCELPLHVIVLAHVGDTKSTKGENGHAPLVYGKAKVMIPAIIKDVLWLDVDLDEGDHARRRILTSPQGVWTYSARSLSGVKSVPANFEKFIAIAQRQLDARMAARDAEAAAEPPRKSKKTKRRERVAEEAS